MNTTHTHIETQLVRIDGRLDSLDMHVEHIDTRLVAVESRLVTVDSRLDAVESRLGSLETKVESVDGRLDSLQREFDAFRPYVNKQFDQIHERFTAIDGVISRMATKDDLKNVLEHIDAKIDTIVIDRLDTIIANTSH